MSKKTAPTPSLPLDGLEPAMQQQAIVAALRDLIWRVDHVRSLLGGINPEANPQELIALLDTNDARAALGLTTVQVGRAAGERRNGAGEVRG